MADACVGISCTCGFREVGLPSAGLGFDDAACLTTEAVDFIDVVQLLLKGFGGGEEGTFCLARQHMPLVGWCISRGTNALVEEVHVIGLESVVLAEMGGIEMADVGHNGVTNRETLSPSLPRNGEGETMRLVSNIPDGSPHYGGDVRRTERVLSYI